MLGVFVAVMIGFFEVGWLLIRRTRWARHLWRISGMYFRPYRRSFHNPDQRIQADATSFAGTSQDLALGAVGSLVSLVWFTIVLWGLSGPVTVAGVTIARAMIFLAYIYVIIATVIAFKLGKPLVRLNFLNERFTASYRYALVRLRENSENVAFYHGEQVENAGLLGRFGLVINCTIVSVGHRSTLATIHTDELELLGGGRWAVRGLATKTS